MTDTIVTLEQAQALAKGIPCGTCGGEGTSMKYDGAWHKPCPTCNAEGVERYPQGEWPQLVWAWTMDEEGLDLFVPMWWDRLIVGPEWCAAPHVTDAILWLLGTEAWKAKFGDDWELVLNGRTAYLWDFNVMHSWRLGVVLLDLLDAMLKEVMG